MKYSLFLDENMNEIDISIRFMLEWSRELKWFVINKNSLNSVSSLPIRCGVASLVCLRICGLMLKSLSDPSLWLLQVMASCPKRSLRSLRALRLKDLKSATNSTKFSCVSYIMDVVRAFICQGASRPLDRSLPPPPPPPLIPTLEPFLSFSLVTHNRLRPKH